MQVIDVMAELSEIDFSPATTIKEILQNVRTILTTAKYTVPLDREFGLDASILDAPIAVVRAKLTAEIIQAVETYEPRVKVTKVNYEGDGEEGVLTPKVQVRIVDGT